MSDELFKHERRGGQHVAHRRSDEIHELRAEIERLRMQCGGNCRYWEGRWRDEAKENDRLCAEVERLKKERDNFQAGLVDAVAKIERLREEIELVSK